jgi:hypothetical protein
MGQKLASQPYIMSSRGVLIYSVQKADARTGSDEQLGQRLNQKKILKQTCIMHFTACFRVLLTPATRKLDPRYRG